MLCNNSRNFNFFPRNTYDISLNRINLGGDVFSMAQLVLPFEIISIVQWSMILTTLMFLFEAVRVIKSVQAVKFQKRVAEKMKTERVPKPEAEKEVKGEATVKGEERKIGQFALDEYILLKEILQELNEAAESEDFFGRAEKKIKDLNKEEKMESRLNKRLKPLFEDAERLAREEPAKRSQIEEAILEMGSYNKEILVLMGKRGQFETILNTPISATLLPERKKLLLFSALQLAIRYDTALVNAVRKLDALVK